MFSEPDIDGGLVGGASFKPEFAKIVRLSSKYRITAGERTFVILEFFLLLM